jgi:hypothetical protein
MIEYNFTMDGGYILSLADLRRRLAIISNGNHQWAARLTKQRFRTNTGELRRHVMIGYTNPMPGDPIPNYLCFAFPVAIEPVNRKNANDTFVCLHGGLASAVVEGLYLEEGEVKRDCLGDWTGSFDPLARMFVDDPPEGCLFRTRMSLRINGREYTRITFRFELEEHRSTKVSARWAEILAAHSLPETPELIIQDEVLGELDVSSGARIEMKEERGDWKDVSLAFLVPALQSEPDCSDAVAAFNSISEFLNSLSELPEMIQAAIQS